MTYSNSLNLYLACTTNFMLLVYNEHLNFVQKLKLRVRLVNYMHFWESKKKLILAGIDGCFIFDFLVKSKYDAK